MLSEEHAAIEAKRRGLTYAGFGYWKDKSGYTVAKSVEDKLQFIPKIKSKDTYAMPVDIPSNAWEDEDGISYETPFNRPEILQKRYVNFKELTTSQMKDILKIAKSAISSVQDTTRGKQDPPYWHSELNQKLSNKKLRIESGADKVVIIGRNWVIKISALTAMERERDAMDHLAAHKKLHKYIPETYFFNYKKYGIQIQKKYDPDPYGVEYDPDKINKFKKLNDILLNLGFADIHPYSNVGWDSDGNPKLIDLGE